MRTRQDLDNIMAAGDGLVLRTPPSPAAIISSKSRLVLSLQYNKDYKSTQSAPVTQSKSFRSIPGPFYLMSRSAPGPFFWCPGALPDIEYKDPGALREPYFMSSKRDIPATVLLFYSCPSDPHSSVNWRLNTVFWVTGALQDFFIL